MISKKEAKEKTLRSIAPDFLNRLEHKIQEEANKGHMEIRVEIREEDLRQDYPIGPVIYQAKALMEQYGFFSRINDNELFVSW